ncbi:lactate dehydrogenase [Bordetella genomosp. 10]|uniref:Lactate dehydrogenase n=1 Tax=Bordetella genomosp. 10 TaxID=1416804 RepID=A0A261S329_9BORD|nr:Ldh family oxidoreductase [Bordetella genomosp. 10]OZI31200.1 lactate dehydrogenase [Bordetella genomosp. 10]
MSENRYAIVDLVAFGAGLLAQAGMEREKAQRVAELLVETDAMGRRTHGLALLPLYLSDIAKGSMTLEGSYEIVSDRGAALVIDARRLPGLWLMDQAISLAASRVASHGVVSIAIRRSHHIGCLATLTRLATDRGLVATIANSEPSAKRVAPYGGKEALFTPNPFAFGYPGQDHPVLVDICASITTTSMTRTKHALGERFEHKWLLDGDGRATDDPAVLEHTEPRGSLQLIGGQEYGHKGFGLALMIEALSQGLSGYGRADKPVQWGGGNVFLQVLDPDFFAGRDEFQRQTGFFGDACRANPPVDPARPVRLPGDEAARLRRAAMRDGIAYAPVVWRPLAEAAKSLGVSLPASRAAGG